MNANAYSAGAVKKSALHFLIGKTSSAILTFCSLLLLVRLLSTQDYGVYVVLLAFMELAITFFTLGLPWIAARYIPEYRLHASGDMLYRLMQNLLLSMTGILLLASFIFYVFADQYVHYADLKPYQQVVELYIFLFFLEGVARRIREDLLGPLLMQGIAQISLFIKGLVFLVGLVYISGASVDLVEVVILEIAASLLSLTVCTSGLIIGILRIRSHSHEELTNWQAPKIGEMITLAKSMYLTQLVTLAYSPQLLLIMIQRVASLETVAVLGFMRNLYGLSTRYLPAKLLFSIIRPKLVASYVNGGGVAALSENASLVGKLSLFVLMPIVVWVCVSGEEIIALLSGGKFTTTGFLFALFMLSLIPVSQRQILETAAVTTGNSALCFVASLLGLIIMPVSIYFIYQGQGLEIYVVPLSLLVTALIFNLIVLLGVVRKTGFSLDTIGFGKLLCVSLLVFFIAKLIPVHYAGLYAVLINFSIIIISFLAFNYIFGVFSKKELLRLSKVIKK